MAHSGMVARKWRRAGVVGFCLAAAGLALGSGLDRAAAINPGLARFVPPPFAAASLVTQGTRLLEVGQYRAALRVGSEAVRRAPVEPESAALVGAARLGMRDGAGADAAFRVAGNFGWRTPVTQYYWMSAALGAGDYRVAALRLDAMLRQQPRLADKRELTAPLEVSASGREALAARLMADPAWLRPYARAVTNVSAEDLERRTDVFDRLARGGRILGCADAGPLTTGLIQAGRIAQASRTWQRHCTGPARTLLADADFSRLQVHAADSPFDWVVMGDSDVSLSLAAAAEGGRRNLVLASTASFPRKVLTQLVPLALGRYRLMWRSRTEGGVPSDRIVATAACQPDSREWLAARLDAASGRYYADFTIDGACAARWIGFAILPGSETLGFGELDLTPLR